MHKPSLVLDDQFSEPSDEDLVHRIGCGDRPAEAQLATRYRDSLVRLGERHGLAEDASAFSSYHTVAPHYIKRLFLLIFRHCLISIALSCRNL